MKKRAKILIVLVVASILLFAVLNVFFPHDGYFYSFEQCENNYKKSLTDGKLVLKIDTDDAIFEVWINKGNEIYVSKTAPKETLFGTKYKVSFSKGYSIEKALQYYQQTGTGLRINAPEINTDIHSNVLSWSICGKDYKNATDKYATITYSGGEFLFLYALKEP